MQRATAVLDAVWKVAVGIGALAATSTFAMYNVDGVGSAREHGTKRNWPNCRQFCRHMGGVIVPGKGSVSGLPVGT